MMKIGQKQTCPKCGGQRIREWNDLTDDQRMLAERLPASAQFTPTERKKHRFCTRCWFEFIEQERTGLA